MDSTQQISLGQAFSHCASTGSYWLEIAIALAVSAGIIFVWIKAAKTQEVNVIIQIILRFVIALLILCSIMVRPCNVMVNTSQEMAARGHYLGY